MKRAATLVPLLAALSLLSACGLQPVYSGGAQGSAATALSDVAVGPIPDRSGYLMQQALRTRLGPMVANPRYRLDVELEDRILGFGIRTNNSITAERVTLRARYTVKDAAGKVLLLETTGSDVTIDRVSSDYAVVAAESSALENLTVVVAQQIADRLALFAKSGGLAPATVPAPQP